MAIKTFTAGEILTAADTNTYLANSGLVYVSSTTVGTGVASVTLSSVFSSTYDSYRVILRGMKSASPANVYLTFGSTTTGYYGTFYYDNYNGGSTGQVRRNNGSNLVVGTTDTSLAEYGAAMDIHNPFIAMSTTLSGMYYGFSESGWYGGTQASSTSFTSLVITPSTTTFTGGTIIVYGYRKA